MYGGRQGASTHALIDRDATKSFSHVPLDTGISSENSKTNMVRVERTQKLIALQQQTPEQPYSILHRLALATAYKSLGYPDLAAGDAYKALLLVDEVIEETEYHDEAMEAAEIDYLSNAMAHLGAETGAHEPPSTEDKILSWVRSDCLRKAYVSIDEGVTCPGTRS